MFFKYKSILLLLALLALQYMAKAQSEGAPPASFILELENLKSPTPVDTAAKNIVLTMQSKQYTLSVYNLSKRFDRPVSAVKESTKRLNELISSKQTIAYKILTLISNIHNTALYLCRNDFDFGNKQPIQHKIAYSWGSKEYKIKQRPPGINNYCDYEINGLDCSGFIYQLFKLNKVNFPMAQCNAETERKTTFLRTYLLPYLGGTDFEVRDLGRLPLSQMQSGDIIYFKNNNGVAYHIGILFVNNAGTVSLYQSLGQPNRNPSSSRICETNMDEYHGPIAKIIDDRFVGNRNNTYSCVRIIAADGR